MVSGTSLPPRQSPYTYPTVVRGEGVPESQEDQLAVAQIASIILAAATAQTAIENTLSAQLVALARSVDLASTAGAKIFSETAATLVAAGIRKAAQVGWAAVAKRAEAAGVQGPTAFPTKDEFVESSRGSDLVEAYRRVAAQYMQDLKRPTDDPLVQKIAVEMSRAGISPLPKPADLSGDVIQEEPPSATEQAVTEVITQAEARAQEQTPTTGSSNRVGVDRETRTEAWASGTEVVLDLNELDELVSRVAQARAEERATQMVSQDIAATMRNAQAKALDTMGSNVVGFRRVVHPELSKTGSCGLCIVASTHLYTKGELLPIHAGCKCGVAEIYEREDGVIFDPGQAINDFDLDVFYADAGDSTRGWDLKRSRYQVVDHPEFGPTLVNKTSRKKEAASTPVPFTEQEDGGRNARSA